MHRQPSEKIFLLLVFILFKPESQPFTSSKQVRLLLQLLNIVHRNNLHIFIIWHQKVKIQRVSDGGTEDFIDRFRSEIPVPLVHIVEETIRCCRERNPQGAWLTATTGTMQTGLFQEHARKSGYRFRVPTEAQQQEIHSLILQVKAGELEAAAKRYRAVCEALWAEERLPIAEACTELPIAYTAAGLPAELGVSSLEALADGCLRELYKPLK